MGSRYTKRKCKDIACREACTNLTTYRGGRSFFNTKVHAFHRLNIGSLPLSSTPRSDEVNLTSSNGLEEEVIEGLKALQNVDIGRQKAIHAPGILPQTMETSLLDTIRVQISLKIKAQVPQDFDPNDEEGQLSLSLSELYRVNPNHGKRRKRKLTEPAVSGVTPSEETSRHRSKTIAIAKLEDCNLERGGHSRARRTSGASAHEAFPTSNSPPSQTDDADRSQVLLYNSKDRVRKNDLVIRIRDHESMEGGRNKFNRIDVYDGPFRISRLLKFSGLLDPRKSVEKNNISCQVRTPSLETTDMERMKETLVKLHFPHNSKGKALTKLGRLRPVYGVPQNVPADCDPRSCYNSGNRKN